MLGEQPGGDMHVCVRVHQHRRPAHRHVRGHVHVRQLLRAQPDHGTAGHVARLVGAGGVVHSARRHRRVTAATAAAPQAASSVPGDDSAQWRGRGRRRYFVVGGQEVSLPTGVSHATDAEHAAAVGSRKPCTVHQLHFEQPAQLFVQARGPAIHDHDHNDDHDDNTDAAGTVHPGSGRQRQQGGFGLVA